MGVTDRDTGHRLAVGAVTVDEVDEHPARNRASTTGMTAARRTRAGVQGIAPRCRSRRVRLR
ncbi:MAG: hypothetical protein R2712_21145 [Vicinamibacterales bacterium]